MVMCIYGWVCVEGFVFVSMEDCMLLWWLIEV